jgi:hypothetical protein
MMYMMTEQERQQVVAALWVVAEHNKLHHGETNNTVTQCEAALAMLEAMQPVSPVEANNDHVICPQCCHQFRAIPVNVQEERRVLLEALKEMVMRYETLFRLYAPLHYYDGCKWESDMELGLVNARAAVAAEKGATP